MALLNIPLTKEDYEQADWQSVIAGCEAKDCWQYEHEFLIKAGIAKSEENAKVQEVFTVLHALSSLAFRLDDKKRPLVHSTEIRGVGRSAALDDISEAHLDILKEIVSEVHDADMCARIADSLWIRRRGNFQHVEIAIQAYLESATTLLNPKDCPRFSSRLERALQLALQINSRDKYVPAVVSHIDGLIDQYVGTTPTLIQTKMMQLLYKYRQGDSAKYVTLAANEAERMEKEGATEAARVFWEIKEGWHATNEDQAAELRETRMRIAETYAKDADVSLALTVPDYNSAKHHLVQAIEAFRRCGGCQARIDELHLKLLECQKRLPMQMGRIEVPFDPTQFWEASRAAVKDKPLHIALRELALLSSSPDVAQMHDMTQDALKNTILSIVPMEMLNEQGKTVAKSASVDSDDETEAEQVIRNHMFQYAVYHYNLVVLGQIQPALEQISLEHYIRMDDLMPI